MRTAASFVGCVGLILACAPGVGAQTPAANTDIYHVHLAKAAPGQAAARYSSWQDLATDRATTDPAGAGGWAEPEGETKHVPRFYGVRGCGVRGAQCASRLPS